MFAIYYLSGCIPENVTVNVITKKSISPVTQITKFIIHILLAYLIFLSTLCKKRFVCTGEKFLGDIFLYSKLRDKIKANPLVRSSRAE